MLILKPSILFLLSIHLPLLAEPSLRTAWPPTSMDTLRAYNGKLPKSPKKAESKFDTSDLATTIAALEKTFPGAVWAPLGRDAAAMGDALNAYYGVVEGQEDRVAPLKASTATLSTTTNAEIISFLKSAGANFDPKDTAARPFIILDRTSFGLNSQSTKLLTAAYAAWKKNGGKAEDFLYRFNVMNISGKNDSQKDVLDPDVDVRQHLKLQSNILKKNGNPSEVSIFYIPGFADGAAWNDSYGEFKKHRDGLYGIRGTAMHTASRERVIQEQISFLKAVAKPNFKQTVVNTAKELGYDMSEPNPQKAFHPISKQARLKAKMRKFISFATGEIEYDDNEDAVKEYMEKFGLFEKIATDKKGEYSFLIKKLLDNRSEYFDYVFQRFEKSIFKKKNLKKSEIAALDFHMNKIFNYGTINGDISPLFASMLSHIESYGKNPFIDHWVIRLAEDRDYGSDFIREALQDSSINKKKNFRKFIAEIASRLPEALSYNGPIATDSFDAFNTPFFRSVATRKNPDSVWRSDVANLIPKKVFNEISNNPRMRKAFIENDISKIPKTIALCKEAAKKLGRN